jgi:hypothetical protein
MADVEVKTALDDVKHPTETHPPQNLAKWLTTKAIESRNLKCRVSNNEMKESKKQTRIDQRHRRTGKEEPSHYNQDKNRIYESHSQL